MPSYVEVLTEFLLDPNLSPKSRDNLLKAAAKSSAQYKKDLKKNEEGERLVLSTYGLFLALFGTTVIHLGITLAPSILALTITCALSCFIWAMILNKQEESKNHTPNEANFILSSILIATLAVVSFFEIGIMPTLAIAFVAHSITSHRLDWNKTKKPMERLRANAAHLFSIKHLVYATLSALLLSWLLAPSVLMAPLMPFISSFYGQVIAMVALTSVLDLFMLESKIATNPNGDTFKISIPMSLTYIAIMVAPSFSRMALIFLATGAVDLIRNIHKNGLYQSVSFVKSSVAAFKATTPSEAFGERCSTFIEKCSLKNPHTTDDEAKSTHTAGTGAT